MEVTETKAASVALSNMGASADQAAKAWNKCAERELKNLGYKMDFGKANG